MRTATVESPRLLALRSEHGYTDRPDLALPEEPEAVSAACQRDLVLRSRMALRHRQRVHWRQARAVMLAELDGLRQLGLDLGPDVAAVERELARLGQRILRAT